MLRAPPQFMTVLPDIPTFTAVALPVAGVAAATVQ